MPMPTVSIGEYIQTLKRSNLPTVVTEGSDDYKFYRRVENSLVSLGASLFPVGGRGTVLEIFNRRAEIGRNNVVFLVDKDLWVFSGVPAEFTHRKIIMTAGYAIENDLYSDGEVESLLHETEITTFLSELDLILHWYSFAVAKLLIFEACSIADHPNRILDENRGLNPIRMQEIGYTGRDDKLYDIAKSNYKSFLRGKNLIDLIVRQLSSKRRMVKFGKDQIMEIGTSRQGPCMRRISSDLLSVIPLL